ncbi:DUF4097 family beta strand repeat-containing protein [Neglectibacter timonensis]
MSEERRRVLEMLQEGKITSEDALRILEALGEEEKTIPASEEPKLQPPAEEIRPKTDAPAETQAAPITAVVDQKLAGLGEKISGAMEQAAYSLSDVADKIITTMVGKKGTDLDAGRPDSHGNHALSLPPLPPQREGNVCESCPPPMAGETDYSAESGVEDLEEIDISWVSGPVELRPYDGSTVRVTEYSKYPLEEGQRLWMRIAEEKLQIRWSREKNVFGMVVNRGKHLVVELPRKAAAHLENVRCSNVSGDIYVSDIAGEDVSLSSTSGKVTAVNVFAEDLKLGSVSGRVTAQNISAEDLSVTGTSGRVELAGLAAEDVKVSTVSGSIDAYGNAENFHIKSVSGSIALQVAQCPEEAELKTTSGKISLRLPENQGFTAKYSSMSGNFTTDFPVRGDVGGRKGKAIFASGDAEYTLNTMSGSMEIRQVNL